MLDASVLYHAPLRDLFMRLAVNLFQPKWTEDIHSEWIRNLLKNRPDLTANQLDRTRELMNRHGGDCLVTNHGQLVSRLDLPDPDDRHVLAAAISSGATAIVTLNLRDFPMPSLDGFGIRATHPDAFALSLYETDPIVFVAAARTHRSSLVNPRMTTSEYLAVLGRSGMSNTVSQLQNHCTDI